MQRRHFELLLFIAGEAALFVPWYAFLYVAGYNLQLSGIIYQVYTYISPLALIPVIYYDRDLRRAALNTLKSKDVFIFIGSLFVMGYLWGLRGYNISALIYPPAIIEEINFRLVVNNFFAKFTNRGQATVIQALLFMVFYFNYLIFEPHGWQGIFAPLFAIDMFMMGILYGAIYYLRKNIYLDLAVHNTLYDVAFLLPASLGWIPYVMLGT